MASTHYLSVTVTATEIAVATLYPHEWYNLDVPEIKVKYNVTGLRFVRINAADDAVLEIQRALQGLYVTGVLVISKESHVNMTKATVTCVEFLHALVRMCFVAKSTSQNQFKVVHCSASDLSLPITCKTHNYNLRCSVPLAVAFLDNCTKTDSGIVTFTEACKEIWSTSTAEQKTSLAGAVCQGLVGAGLKVSLVF